MLTNRKTLLTSRIALENEIRGTLKAFGLKISRVSSVAFKAIAIELTTDRPRLQAMVRPMPVARAALQNQYEELDTMVLKVVKTNDVCRQLLSVPGDGPVPALAFATAIDDPSRFTHSRNAAAHFGLTPRKYASGEINRNGCISKGGDRIARAAPFLVAHALLTRATKWSTLKAWRMAIAKRRGLRRATVAVARRLPVIMHRLWSDGRVFR